MEVFTCIFLATAFCGQLEPFAGLNYAATVKSVEVWEQEVCKQHFPSYHFGVQGDYSCRCPGFLEIRMKAAAHLGGPQKDVQVPRVCWKYRNRSYAVSEVSKKNTHVFRLKRKTKVLMISKTSSEKSKNCSNNTTKDPVYAESSMATFIR